ncbi:MAG: DegV family protein [Lachnospiraceae bacterium]|nr:DegV family protein [Lachnospiraceae bacterium]
MKYKIVVDSCCELPEEYLQDKRFERVPLGLEVGDYHIEDDDNFNQEEFLKRIAECPSCPKSYCPSPERFMEAYHVEAEHIYVVTISSQLSGSFNSAMLGKSLYEEKYGAKKIHVVDSQSASGGETQIALKLMELEEQGLSFEEIVEKIEQFRDTRLVYFVLDNLETLRKNGRLSAVKAFVASTLNIKPVMSADKGMIIQKGQGIGFKKALAKMADMILKEITVGEERKLIITHCNAPERAELVKQIITKHIRFADVIVMDTRGLSSMYANEGGVIVTA